MKKIVLTGLFTLMMIISFAFSNVVREGRNSEEASISVKQKLDTCESRDCIIVDGTVYCSEWKEVPCPDDGWDPVIK